MPDETFYIDPAGVFIRHNNITYYRDGVLYGHVIEPQEDPVYLDHKHNPTVWSHIVAMYRTRPRQIEAIQISTSNGKAVANWCGARLHNTGQGLVLEFPTFDGLERAFEGDYIVKHPEGHFEKFGPEKFASRFEIL